MSYIDDSLMSGEHVIYRAKLHWVVFLWPVIWLVLGLLLASGRDTSAAGRFFLLIGVLSGIGALINYQTSEFGLTNKRVLGKTGLIRRNSLEILLTKVEAIQINQGVVGRVFGYGTIVVGGTGGSKNPFRRISDPLEFRRAVQQQIAAVQKSG